MVKPSIKLSLAQEAFATDLILNDMLNNAGNCGRRFLAHQITTENGNIFIVIKKEKASLCTIAHRAHERLVRRYEVEQNSLIIPQWTEFY